MLRKGRGLLRFFSSGAGKGEVGNISEGSFSLLLLRSVNAPYPLSLYPISSSLVLCCRREPWLTD